MFRIFSIIIIFLVLPMTANSEDKFHQFKIESIDGKEIDFADFKGKLVLVVNTASHCGLTPQYQALEEIYEKYKDYGFVVIGMPSNDFGGQESETCEIIKNNITAKYHVTFPLTTKIHVKGKEIHPIYSWLARNSGFFSLPRWNFHKYLISTDGKIIDWFTSTTSPNSTKILKAIEKNLPKKYEQD